MGSVENESPRKRKKPSSDEHDSSLTDDSEDANKFITVLGPNENELVEILLSEDRTLPLVSLDHTFPGAYGLTYVNRTTGRKRSVSFDDWKNALLEPPGGWAKRKYQLIFKPKLPPAASAVSETTNTSRPSTPYVTPYVEVRGKLPKEEAFRKYCYFIYQQGIKSCVVCLKNYFFATFRHGTHKNYNIGDVVVVHNYEGTDSTEATVRYISEYLDFIILRSYKKIEDVPYICAKFLPSEELLLCGRASENGDPSHNQGCIFTSRLKTFSNENSRYGPFLLGTIRTSPRDSGAAVFGARGLIGMNAGIAGFGTAWFELFEDMATRAAHFKVLNYMVQAADLESAVSAVERQDSPPLDAEQPRIIKVDGKILTED